jgi:deoxyribose-phosphate aldolase
MSSPRDLDAIADVVAERVREALARRGDGKQLRDLPCHAPPETCVGCGLCAARRPWDVEALTRDGAARIGAGPGLGDVGGLAKYIDHTLLKPEATKDELRHVCQEARQHHFATVCVNSANVGFVARLLAGSDVKPIAVVGFPLGATLPSAKAFETREAIRCGAREIDMVLNVGALKSREYDLVERDIRCVVEAAGAVPVKVILETVLLDDEEKVIACALAKAAGAAFVKTSTGFGKGGATTHDVALMRRVVGADLGVKASGGVRTREDVEAMIKAGANRIGASASVAIVTGEKTKQKGY